MARDGEGAPREGEAQRKANQSARCEIGVLIYQYRPREIQLPASLLDIVKYKETFPISLKDEIKTLKARSRTEESMVLYKLSSDQTLDG